MKKKQATGITVYHGSSEVGIVDLETNQPPEGGIGYGIYVTDDFETAKFYGDTVYELRLMLDPDKDILYVGYEFDNADAVAGTEGQSVLVGEHVEPFSFWIRDQRYTVGFDNTPDVAESEYIKEHVFDVDFPDPIYDGLNNYFAALKRHGDTANLEDFVDELGDYVDLEKMNALYPDRDFIENDEDYKLLRDRIGALLEPVTNRAREIVEKYIGLVIDLMDIGQEARSHGYRAVKMEGVRGLFPDTEILVFDPEDLVMVGEVTEEPAPNPGTPLDQIRTTPEIEELEEAWRGGIADFGDPEAAQVIHRARGYSQYKAELERSVLGMFGPRFTMYRCATLDEALDVKSGTGHGPKSFTFDLAVAKNWQNFAAHEEDPDNPLVVYSAEVEPDMIVMRGKPDEAELVVNTSDINGYYAEILS